MHGGESFSGRQGGRAGEWLADGRLGQAEVHEFRAGFGQHDVGRFQITVDQTEAVSFRQGVSDFDGDLEEIVERQRPSLQAMEKRFAFEEFHDQEVDAGLRADVIEMADIGMRNRGESAGFAFKAAFEFGAAGQVGRKDFDGDAAVEAGVARPVDFTHAACADGSDDFVRAESASGRQVHDGRGL